MGERVRELRKTLGLSGERFGEKIGLKKVAVSQIETGRNGLSEQNILAICREFNVNEEWLRYGTGNMFLDMSLDEEITSFMGDMQWEVEDTFKKKFIAAIARLNDDEWKTLEKVIRSMVEEENKKD